MNFFRHIFHRRLLPHHPRRAPAPAPGNPPRLPRYRRGPRPHLALRHGAAFAARLARRGHRILRSEARRCHRGQPQSAVEGGAGGGRDAARRGREVKIAISMSK